MCFRMLCLALTCGFWCATGGPATTDDAPAPPKVEVCQPVSREVVDYEQFSGRLEAAQSAELKARTSGYLANVNFKDGSAVKKGDLLFEIDPRPCQAEVDRAQAEVARCEARLKRLSGELARAKALGNALTRDELEKIAGDMAEAEAGSKGARASLELARLNLGFTKVSAPIDGRIGRALVTTGNVVTADTTVLATLVSEDPIYAYFDVDERSLLRLKQLAKDKTEQEVLLETTDASGRPRRGKIDFIDNRVNVEIGAVRARAIFANADQVLMPGMFVRVRVASSAPHTALLVPASAIRHELGVASLLVVNDQNVVEQRTIQPGHQHDDLRAVNKGLAEREWIIVGEAGKIEAGMKVEPKRVALPAKPQAGEKR